MLKDFIEVGKIVGTHGVRGALRVQPWCDSADFFVGFNYLYLSSDGKQAYKCTRSAAQKNVMLVWLEGIDSVEKASDLRGKVLYVSRKDIKLEDGKYLVQDILGCKVLDAESGQEYGLVSDVFNTGANDIWEIKSGEKEYLIPVIDGVLKSVDVNERIVNITPMKGIFDED